MNNAELFWAFLADLILAVHVAFVGFVVGGLVVVWIGGAFAWAFVRNRRFRLLHLLAMGIVVGQTLIEVICPLTQWEVWLREQAGQPTYADATFVQYWLQRLLYWDWSPRTFMIVYLLFFAAMLLSWWVVPPRRMFRS